MKKTKRVSVSLPIPLLEKLYHSWQVSKSANFSEFITSLLEKELENHETNIKNRGNPK